MKRVKALFYATICLLCVNLLSTGCSKDELNVFDYPEGAVLPKGDDAKPFKLKDFQGTLSFDELKQEWVIKLKYVGPPIAYSYTGYVIYVSNMTDEYKAMAGEVLFSGIMKKLYAIPANPNICYDVGINYFSIELTEITALDTSVEE